MKLLSPFVAKHITISPKIISLIFFMVCLMISLPIAFISTVGSLGDYYHFDSNHSKQVGTFYSYVNSEFAKSSLGQLATLVSYVFSILFTLIATVTLNMASFVLYKAYLKKRKGEAEAIQTRINNIQPVITSRSGFKKFPADLQKIIDEKERNQHKIENSMFFMAITLSLISIVGKIVITFGFVCFFVLYSSSFFLFIRTIVNTVFVLVPATSIFVFFNFNEMFRNQLKKSFGLKEPINVVKNERKTSPTV